MEQIYISIDDFIHNGIDNLAIEMPVGEWEKMSALLDIELPAKKQFKNFRNIIFWGASLLIVALFVYQQWNRTVSNKAILSCPERKTAECKRIVSPTVLKSEEPSTTTTVDVSLKPIINAPPIIKDTIKPKLKYIELPKHSKKSNNYQKTSSSPNNISKNLQDEYSEKDQVDYFGIASDSIIYDNIGKVKKKKRK